LLWKRRFPVNSFPLNPFFREFPVIFSEFDSNKTVETIIFNFRPTPLPRHFFWTILNPYFVSSCAAHCRVELKAYKWMSWGIKIFTFNTITAKNGWV
jgi:hypothetical protein